ncbi:uncharacterized protein LOC122533657 [Frieseomelitta varia]|uniref:uncharacterized protein LOC122533657 n=1 Tax=Frieseomelitta varia TaxID=561572 RepID=UPI001CB6986D|nr:uncharacterized protein LOC122533657 [Frieseomelitta varia]
MTTIDIQRDLNYQFGWSRYIMKYVGIWPEERKWNRPSSYVVLIPFLTMLCFGCGPQTIDLPFIAHDLDLFVENLSMANMTVTIALVKTSLRRTLAAIFPFLQALKSLLRCIAKDWATVETKTERERMVNIAKISRKTMVACTSMCEFVAIFFLFLRLFLMKRNDSKSLILQGYFPYNTTISPNFELTEIAQAIAIIYTAASYSAVDTFVAMLVLHACGQLSNIKHDLRNVHSCGNSNVLQMKLKKIARKHDYVNSLCDGAIVPILLRGRETHSRGIEFMKEKLISRCFSDKNLDHLAIRFQHILTFAFFQSIDIADTAYHCEWYNLPPKDAGLLIIIMCRATSSPLKLTAGKFCCFTILLYSQSMDIANAVYHCEWYNLRPKDARLLIIIMCRARASPLKLTAGKFCWFTVTLYTHVLKTSMSCISVLYATRL